MLLNLEITTTSGEEVLRVVDGHLLHRRRREVAYERVPGHVMVSAPISEEFMPEWALTKVREHDPQFAADKQMALLDLEVVEPGAVQIHQGVWVHERRSVALTQGRLLFMTPEFVLAMVGDDTSPDDTTFAFAGPYTDGPVTLFGFGSPGVVPIPLPGAD